MRQRIAFSLGFLLLTTGCQDERDKRLEQIEKQHQEIRELHREKAKEVRRLREGGELANPIEGFKKAFNQDKANKRQDTRFNNWLTRDEVIEHTGLTEEEIDELVLRGKLKSVRRPALEVLYDPVDVKNLMKERQSPTSSEADSEQ